MASVFRRKIVFGRAGSVAFLNVMVAAAVTAGPVSAHAQQPDRPQAHAHLDHAPKHGGVFFMAPDGWHHVEGTYPEPGVFRVYLYDNYTQPLDARVASGRAVIKEVYDEASRTTREIVVYPVASSPDGRYLEAQVGDVPLPVDITLKVRLTPTAAEDRFDFSFAERSADPEQSAGAEPSRTLPPQAWHPLDQLVIPDRPAEIASAIRERDRALKELIERGAFAEVFIPALEAKELALALDGQLESLPESQRTPMRLAIKQLVRAAWLLDSSGDLGDLPQVTEAYSLFAAAAEVIGKTYQ